MDPLEVLVERFFVWLAGATGLLFLVLIIAIVALFYLQWKQNQKTNKIIKDFDQKLKDLEQKLEGKIKTASGEEAIKSLRQDYERWKGEADKDYNGLKKWLDDKLEGMRTRYENYIGQIEKLTGKIEEARNAVAQGVAGVPAVGRCGSKRAHGDMKPH